MLDNRSRSSGNWIRFRLIGRASSRHPVGAILRVRINEHVEVTQQIRSGGSYASSSDPRLLVGVGEAKGGDSVAVRWPSGIEQVIDAHVDRAKREMTGDGLEFGQIPPQGRIREQTLLLTTGYCANTPVEETYMKAWDAFRRIVEAD